MPFKLRSKLWVRLLHQCLTLSWYYSLMETGWIPGYSSSIFLSLPPVRKKVDAECWTRTDRWSSSSNEEGEKMATCSPLFFLTLAVENIPSTSADEGRRWITFDVCCLDLTAFVCKGCKIQFHLLLEERAHTHHVFNLFFSLDFCWGWLVNLQLGHKFYSVLSVL